MTRLADWATRPRRIDEWAELVITGLVLVGCTLFVFVALHPSKLFLRTLTAGGDMGAHVWAPQYLKSHLFPHGRISGWAPAWYDGFPALTFYFPGPYVVIALLSYVIPYDIAFKLVSVSGCVLLPVSAYVMGRLTRMKFPGPPLLAVAMVPYLFDRYWTIYGGNIASTLAGEFAFEISLCFALLFIGVFAYSLETGKYRWLAAGLLAATLFCHLLPTFFAIAGGALVWLLQPTRRRLAVGLLIGAVGLAITGFWLLPFAMRLGYSNDMGWTRTTAFMKGLFPFMCNTHHADSNVNCPTYNVVSVYTVHLKIVVALAAAGVLGGLALRRRATLLIGGLALWSAAAFRLMPQGTLWNARMLPFWYLSLYLAAAACVAESAQALGVLLGRSPRTSGEPAIGDDPSQDAPPVDDEALYDGALDDLEDGVQQPDREYAGREYAGRELASLGAGSRGSTWGVDGPDAGPTGLPVAPTPPPAVDQPPRVAYGWAQDPGLSDRGGAGGGDPDDEPPPLELIPSRWPSIIAALLVAVFVLSFVGQSVPDYQWFFNRVLGHHSIGGAAERANPNFVSGWANWNYSGYQEKSAYPEYTDIIKTMNKVGAADGCGRALWEYEPEEDRFGTPMALMLLPQWTGGCINSEEGLFFESSSTVPYHFLDQSELSVNPSRAMVGLPYRDFNIVDGIEHLQLLGVRYYMAISPEAQAAAQTLTTGPNPLLTLVGQTGSHEVQYTVGATTTNEARTWQIYEVADSDTVAPLAFDPAVMKGVPTTGKGWNNLSIPWYQDSSRWAVPLAASGPSNWPRVKGAALDPPRVPVHPAQISDIVTTDDRITFNVDPQTVADGSPVLVKTSYFPNWQAIGANGPWRVTPNLMVVVPTSTHVELHYGFTPVDNAGRLLSVGGLVAAGTLAWRERTGADPVPAEVPVPEPVATDAAADGPGDGADDEGDQDATSGSG